MKQTCKICEKPLNQSFTVSDDLEKIKPLSEGLTTSIDNVLLHPLCLECYTLCYTNPDTILTEHPSLLANSSQSLTDLNHKVIDLSFAKPDFEQLSTLALTEPDWIKDPDFQKRIKKERKGNALQLLAACSIAVIIGTPILLFFRPEKTFTLFISFFLVAAVFGLIGSIIMLLQSYSSQNFPQPKKTFDFFINSFLQKNETRLWMVISSVARDEFNTSNHLVGYFDDVLTKMKHYINETHLKLLKIELLGNTIKQINDSVCFIGFSLKATMIVNSGNRSTEYTKAILCSTLSLIKGGDNWYIYNPKFNFNSEQTPTITT